MSDSSCGGGSFVVQTSPAASDRSPQLPDLVHDLLGSLDRLRGGQAVGGRKRAVRRFRDDDFHYLEVALPGLDGVEADINIHEGRLYIRVMR